MSELSKTKKSYRIIFKMELEMSLIIPGQCGDYGDPGSETVNVNNDNWNCCRDEGFSNFGIMIYLTLKIMILWDLRIKTKIIISTIGCKPFCQYEVFEMQLPNRISFSPEFGCVLTFNTILFPKNKNDIEIHLKGAFCCILCTVVCYSRIYSSF